MKTWTFPRELSLALRSLRRSPGYSLIIVLTLVLALGGNAVVLSLVDATILKPLPYTDADGLVVLWDTSPERGIDKDRVTGSNYRQWVEQNEVFEQMAIFRYSASTLTSGDTSVRILGSKVTAEYFPMLGVQPLHGRSFRPEEFEPGGAPVVILSHALWNQQFNADPEVLDSKIFLAGETPRIVVGIMPKVLFPCRPLPSAKVFFDAGGTQYWIPITEIPTATNSHTLGVLARLKDGVSLAAANLQMKTVAERLAVDFPDSNAGYGVLVVPLLEEAVGEVKTALWTLLGAVIFVLLIACANISNLVLVRAASRDKESALRLALGARHRQLWTAFLAEGVILSLSGLAVGMLFAFWALRVLPEISPGNIPRLGDAVLDVRVLGMALGLSLFSGLVISMVPAARLRHLNLESKLREGGREGRGGSSSQQRLMVGIEVALAVVLVIGSGLLIRSFYRLQDVDPGFDTDQVLSVEIQHQAALLDDMAHLTGFYNELRRRVEALPGVRSAALAYDHPLISNWSQGFTIEDAPEPPPGQSREALFRTVGPGYLETMGIELRDGRDFTDGDDATSHGVVLVNQAFVERFFEDHRALGRKLSIYTTQWLWGPDGIPSSFEIVGIVANVKLSGLAGGDAPAFYLPYLQTPHLEMRLLARAERDAGALLPEIRQILYDLNPQVPVVSSATLDEVLLESIAQPKFNMLLLSVFAAFSLFLAVLGVWGVLNNIVRQQRRELGIRMALGASRARVFRQLLRYGVQPALIGVVVGILAALAGQRLLAGLLYDVSSSDPLTYLLGPAVLLATSLLACLAPAWQASRTNPMTVLREE